MTQKPSWVRRWPTALLAAYALCVAAVVLTPWGSVPSRVVHEVSELLEGTGANAAFTDESRMEVLLNILMVVPLTAALAALWGTRSWRDWTAWSFVTSCGVELVQGLLLDHRSASVADVCANTAGGLLGAVTVSAGRMLVRVRRADGAQSAP